MDSNEIVSFGSLIVALVSVIVSGSLGALGFRHARRLAWSERVWQRRADLYVDLLEWIMTARSERKPFSPMKADEKEERTPPLLRLDLGARIAAFASFEVREAYVAAIEAIDSLEKAQSAELSVSSGDKRRDVFRSSTESGQKISALQRQIQSELGTSAKKPRVMRLLARRSPLE